MPTLGLYLTAFCNIAKTSDSQNMGKTRAHKKIKLKVNLHWLCLTKKLIGGIEIFFCTSAYVIVPNVRKVVTRKTY